MTGLPKSMINQNQSLKFKPRKQHNDISDTSSQASTMSARTAASASNLTDKQLIHDNKMITNELIVLNREHTKLKSDLKHKTESLKKTDRAYNDIRTKYEQKDNALEKLRIERDELFNLVNTDKYRDFRTVEDEKFKFEEKLQRVTEDMEELK